MDAPRVPHLSRFLREVGFSLTLFQASASASCSAEAERRRASPQRAQSSGGRADPPNSDVFILKML
jgi:hypothetical protein